MLVVAVAFVLVESQYYTDYWAVHLDGGPEVARNLAEKHSFTYIDTVRLSLRFTSDLK